MTPWSSRTSPNTWREQQAEKKSRNQSAHMRRHTDVRLGNIECDLDRDDQANVCEPLFGQRVMMMSQQKSSPRADHAHDAAGSAYKLRNVNESNCVQADYAGT